MKKRIISVALALVLALSVGISAYAAEAIKGSAENPYKFKDIPATWIKQVKKDNLITGYIITVPDKKTATFQLSGTTFKEYRIKGSDGKYGEAIALTNGKLRTIKDVSVIWVILRKPQTPAPKPPATSQPAPSQPAPSQPSGGGLPGIPMEEPAGTGKDPGTGGSIFG